jgi:ABC-type Zn uptake system ZnuABC Zn-binding protein ZnuA
MAPRGSRLVVGLTLAGSLAAAACGPAPGPGPRVAATIFPVYDIVREVAGPDVAVSLILPPGASPHTFEPTPGAMRELAGSRAVFVIGHGLDGWASRMAEGVGIAAVLPVDRGIDLLPAAGEEARGGESADPHYWLSLANAATIAQTVEADLEKIVPGRTAELRSRLAAYRRRLASADAGIRETLAGLPDRRIATFHDAFRYFARAYGLEVVAVFEPYPGREPSPRYVRNFEDAVRKAKIRTLFAEPQISVEAIRPVARELGVSVSELDAVGGVAGRESLDRLLLWDAGQIAAAARRNH